MKTIVLKHIYNILEISEEELNNLKNRKLHEITNDVGREKLLVYWNYYNFMNNEECLEILEKIYKIVLEHNRINLSESSLVISIIILKSFTDKKILNMGEKFINSDEIFNYCVDNYQKYLILKKIFVPEKQIQGLILQLLDILSIELVIRAKIIKIGGAQYKTHKYYSLPIDTYCYEKSFLSFSCMEFKWIEYNNLNYITTCHYSRTYLVTKKNFNSQKSFKIKDTNYMIRKINTKLYIDKDYQELLKDEYTGELTTMKEDIRILLEKINSFYGDKMWTIETKKQISETQAEIAKIQNDISCIFFANYDFGDIHVIYPLFLDFRGRKYYHSIIGPTNSKILRLAYYYGYYEDDFFKKKKNKYSIHYKKQITEFCAKNGFNYDDSFLETYFWLLIGIGKFFKTKEDYPIKTNDFINLGINAVEQNSKVIEIEDNLEIAHYKNCMKSLNHSKIKKRIIIKDATASINQIFMKKLGPLNKDSLKYVNLGDKNEWHDTYLVYRDKFVEYFLKTNKNFNEKELREKLPRKGIKNTIMIIPYSGGFELCWNNFSKITKINEKDFKSFYKNFYTFVKNEAQEQFLYRKSTQSFVNKINEEFQEEKKYILDSETGFSDISYYKLKKSSIDRKYTLGGTKKRISKLILEPTAALDIESFNTAASANTAHFFDAEEIRAIEIELGYSIITIHDSYLIDMGNCSELIDKKIKIYQKAIEKFEKNHIIANIFILL